MIPLVLRYENVAVNGQVLIYDKRTGVQNRTLATIYIRREEINIALFFYEARSIGYDKDI